MQKKDKITLGYLGFTLLMILFCYKKFDFYFYILTLHIAISGVVGIIILKKKECPFVYSIYPLLLYTFFYIQTGYIQEFWGEKWDKYVIPLERTLFKGLWYNELHNILGSRWLDEIIYASYFSYYFLIGGTLLFIYFKRKDYFEEFLYRLSFLFYICYICYMFIPIEGPIPLPSEYPEGIFPAIMKFIYAAGEKGHGAFPSSHVAVALFIGYSQIIYKVPGRLLWWIIIVLLVFSTVYCKYHYCIDVVGGVILFLVFVLWYNKGDNKKL